MRYIFINRLTGEWLEWATLHYNANAVDALHSFMIGVPMRRDEEIVFSSMVTNKQSEVVRGLFVYRILPE